MIENKEIKIAKEIDDVMVFVIELLKDIKEKKDVSALVGENLTNLINAIGGVDKIGEEFESKDIVLSTIGYRLGELAGVFVSKKEELK